jgi:hypothetical protein
MMKLFFGVVAALAMGAVDHLMLPARVSDLSTMQLGTLVFTHAAMAVSLWSDK